MELVIKERPALADLLTKAGLAPLFSADASITLLAPPEAALQSMKQESPERLRAILSAHIIKGSYQEKDFKDGATLKSISGAEITVCRKKDHTLVNGVRIQEANQPAKNGVLHSLSGIIRI
ncbi:fasciclin domain-containing protein [Pontibacter oryzae]|nr:fasciclin domain-containing protein [Pontibacter oryzae]